MIRLVLAALAVVLAVPVSAGFAAQKAAVFPFELVVPPKEDDFFIGASPPNTALQCAAGTRTCGCPDSQRHSPRASGGP